MMERIAEAVDTCKTFLVVSHIRPDGDAVGSELAMYHVLRAMGKSVVVFSQDKIPDVYKFLPGSEVVVHRLDSVERFDAAILLDCSDLERVGNESARIGSIKNLINIDHHVSNNGSEGLSMIDTEASSTGEILYRLIERLGVVITKDIAINIYTAILTDTGSFHYSNTKRDTFKLAAQLVEWGVDPRFVAQNVYETKPLAQIRLMHRALGTIEMNGGGTVGSITVNRSMIEEEGALPEYTEGLVDTVRSIEGVAVAIFYCEMSDHNYKISLRSKGSIDIERTAREFGGGGHVNAAACRLAGDIHTVKEKVLASVRKSIAESVE